MGNNRLGLIFEIAAQGADKASEQIQSLGAASEAAAKEMVAANRTIAEQLKATGVSAEDARAAYKSLGLSAQETAEQISAAYGSGFGVSRHLQ